MERLKQEGLKDGDKMKRNAWQVAWGFLDRVLHLSEAEDPPVTDAEARWVVVTIAPLVLGYVGFLLAFCFWEYGVTHGLWPNDFQLW